MRLVVVDDRLGHAQLAEERAEVAELVPRAGVEDDRGIDAAPSVAGRLEALDTALGVEEGVARREGAGDDHPRLLAQPFECFGQGQHGPEAVAVGAHVGGQQEALV